MSRVLVGRRVNTICLLKRPSVFLNLLYTTFLYLDTITLVPMLLFLFFQVYYSCILYFMYVFFSLSLLIYTFCI